MKNHPSAIQRAPRGITQKKRDATMAATTVSASKELLAAALRSLGEGVITTDIQGNIDFMNKAAEELCGREQNEAFGKSFVSIFNIINENTRTPHENPVEKALATGKAFELENHTIIVSKVGIERIIAGSAAPIKDGNDRIIGVALAFRDITEKQNLLETSLKKQKLEFLGKLADSIVHDFNNLICGMFGYIDIAIDESKDDKITQYLAVAMKMIDRARDLTQQLLIFTKGRALVKETTQLFPLIQNTAQFSLGGSNVSCQYDIADNLWLCAIDKKQICQVITNIIINAQQAMPRGGTIEISAKNISPGDKESRTLHKGNYVKISIMDHGIGISKERLSCIFDPFFTTKPKSHGLGLATCYLIINRHGGAIEVESIVDEGSTFHLYLPASTEPAAVTTATTKPGHSYTPADVKHISGGTIIVMDDEEAIRDTIGKMLEMLGYSVVCKNDGKGTLDFFIEETMAKRPIIALILDLVIPGGMGGKEVVEVIRKLNSKIPVFVASGYTDDPIMKAPVEYGFTASICKPFRKIELAEMFETYLKNPKIKQKKEILKLKQ